MGKIKIILRKCNTFIKLDNESKLGFIEAFIYTGIFRGYILFVPFNKFRNKIGNVKTESPEIVDDDDIKIAKKISFLVNKASQYTPWESKCLVKALTAQKMLKKKGISTTLYLGVKKDLQNNMLAHAWIRCGNYYVTGGINRQGYAIVAKFSN